jgi:hypothetical protein
MAELFEQYAIIHFNITEEEVIRFPGLSTGQIQMARDIHSYSPISAVRYCEVIKHG